MTNREWLFNKMQNMSDEEFEEIVIIDCTYWEPLYKKCGSKSETSCNSETCDDDVEVTSDAPKANNGQDRQQRFDRPRYTGGDKKH